METVEQQKYPYSKSKVDDSCNPKMVALGGCVVLVLGLPAPTTMPEFANLRTVGLLQPLDDLAAKAVDAPDPNGRERDGSWLRENNRQEIQQQMAGLTARKRAWWLDAPRPLRAVVACDERYELSLLALPGGTTLDAAAYPAGSNIFCQPLVGEASCRRVRLQTGAPSLTLMERSLRARMARNSGSWLPLSLSGGACHEWSAAPGVAAAVLQLVLLPPTSRFPEGGCGIGWRTPPPEGCELNTDTVEDAVIQVSVDEMVALERYSGAARDEEPIATGSGDVAELVGRLRRDVGGLDDAIAQIVRRGLATRLYPRALARELGLPPVRGLLLYGPPGCGKTLVARQVAAALGAREPKVVNGPEMMSKYVGDSEGFIRALFAEAELEQLERGDESALHVIVLDELDAFARNRGSLSGDTSGIRDSVVNQLLAKMDGVEPLNNVLVIGLTNRPELIDDALLRPGRLEVHVRIDPPNLTGRQQILHIHTERLRARGCLDARAAAALDSHALAAATEGYSGAQLAGLVRSAASFALDRYSTSRSVLSAVGGGVRSKHAAEADGSVVEVREEDLIAALREAAPSVGSGASIRRRLMRRGSAFWRERTLRRQVDARLAKEATESADALVQA